MIALYRPGSSPLHRAPAWAKLLALSFLVVAISLVGTWWPGIAAAAVVVTAGYLVAGLGLGELARQIVKVRWLVVVMLVSQFVFAPPSAFANTARVVVVVVLAALLTLTTRMSDLLETLQTALRPLDRLGVPTWQAGLTLALALSSIPVLASLAGQVRDAQVARTGRVRVRGFVMPLLVLGLKHADALADALRARGVDDGPGGHAGRP